MLFIVTKKELVKIVGDHLVANGKISRDTGGYLELHINDDRVLAEFTPNQLMPEEERGN